MKTKILKALAITLLLPALLTACKGSEITPTPLPEVSSAPEPAQIINPMTGLPGFSKSAVDKRPYTVMVSNIKQSLPQWGISKADVWYELLAEGGVTRIMAVFADGDKIPRIGPVRSIRDYYVDINDGINAILVHFGGSPKGYQRVREYGVDDIDGKIFETRYNQDMDRTRTLGREHSFSIDAKTIKELVKEKGFDTKSKKYSLFNFAEEGEKYQKSTSNLKIASTKSVTIPYMFGFCTSYFDYNKKTKKYDKSQAFISMGVPKQKHIDATDNKQISAKNVFILRAKCTPIVGDTSSRISVDLSSGTGWYLCEGKRISITWEKGDHKNSFKYFTMDGKELKVQAGTSYVSICDVNDKVSFEK